MNQLNIFNFIEEEIKLTEQDYKNLNASLSKSEIQDRLNILLNFINTSKYKDFLLVQENSFLHPNIIVDNNYSKILVMFNVFEKDKVELGFKLHPNEYGFDIDFSLSYSSNDGRVGMFGGSCPLAKSEVKSDNLDLSIEANVKQYQERLEYYKETHKNLNIVGDDFEEIEDDYSFKNQSYQLELDF